jgi:hypothetical protein
MISPTSVSVVFIHIGKQLPDYIYDSIYQSLLINGNTCKHYVILDDTLVSEFMAKCKLFNLNVVLKSHINPSAIIQTIPISILQNHLEKQQNFVTFVKQLEKHDVASFRNGFWISTTSRFFYIQALMELFQISDLFHIENDIMMYEKFAVIFNSIKECNSNFDSAIWMVQDSHDRVVPSILFFPNTPLIQNLTNFITHNHLNSHVFLNDMNILGQFQPKLSLPFDNTSTQLIFDGAAIGQYLGGIDLRNMPTASQLKPQDFFQNKTIGFINETSSFKPNTCSFSNANIGTNEHYHSLKMIICQQNNKVINLVANIHIHSKQLYQFSSVLTTSFEHIITGDRILSLCDFVICTNETYQFHKGIEKFAKEIIVVKDWQTSNTDLLNKYFIKYCTTFNTKTIKLFIYTHILDDFQTHIAEHLNKDIDFVLYLHNSDHSFNSKHSSLLELSNIEHVFTQNIDHPLHPKLSLLPIGIANSMWKHGNIVELYTVMKNTYYLSKTKNIYVNINPGTFSYRSEILDYIQKNNTYKISSSKSYIDYLYELSQHNFCLCIRGNGIDTHRFWEALYLGVIPVIINNEKTNCHHFVQHLTNLGVPFVSIEKNNIDNIFQVYNESYFNSDTYLEILKKSEHYILSLPYLKLSFFT